MSGNEAAAAASEPRKKKTYHVGNLEYTKAGLLALFFWLLWGDFCFVLMEGAFGPILQFRLLNDLKADPVFYTLIMATIPGLLNFVMNPIISIKSDRHRGPRGRRIPFLLYSTPFVCGLLALMGFGNEIGAYVQAHFFASMSTATVTVWVFGVMFIVFFMFNMFMNTTFYYLFNDVVPQEHFVKFMAYMRVVGGLAGMLYSWFIWGYSDKSGPFTLNLGFCQWHTDHIWYPKLILVGMALFYLVGFTLACLRIKEPSYPDPPPLAKGDRFTEKLSSTVRTLAKECFGHKFYWLLFTTLTFEALYTAASSFQQPMLKSMGIDLIRLGKIGSIAGFVSIGLTMITASWGDRWHPVPLMVVTITGLVVTAPVALLFLIPNLSPETYLWIRVAYIVTHIPVGIIGGLASGPFLMRLFPRPKYGQFSAAMSMVRTILAGVLGSLLAGGFMKLMQSVHGGSTYYMRYCFVWQMFFQVITLVCYVFLYREWKRLGGSKGYTPPA